MKKLLVMLIALCLMMTSAIAEEITPEANTMVAKIDGELHTLYLAHAVKGMGMAVFCTYNEYGKTDMEFVLHYDDDMKTGTYNRFDKSVVTRCYLNMDYDWDYLSGKAKYTQYIGGIWGTVLGASAADQRRMQNNQGEMVVRIDKATGYLFRGVFTARLHDVKKDEFISVQAKFDFTIGEHYEPGEIKRPDSTLSLDDIDF